MIKKIYNNIKRNIRVIYKGLGGSKYCSYIYTVNKGYMSRINVNTDNSKLIGGRLFITGLKMVQLKANLAKCIIPGSTVKHPTMGLLYEYNGPFSRA